MAKMQHLKINILIVFRNVARFFKKSFWGHPVHPTKIKSGQFENGSLLFDCQYLQHFFIKSNNQGQFRNPQEKLILKLSLVVRFDQELMEILTVKEKISVFELTTFFFVGCRQKVQHEIFSWKCFQWTFPMIFFFIFLLFIYLFIYLFYSIRQELRLQNDILEILAKKMYTLVLWNNDISFVK